MTWRGIAWIVTVFLMAPMSLCAAAPEGPMKDSGEPERRIMELRERFNRAIADHDAASIGSYLGSPYQITTSNGGQFQSTPEEEVATWRKIFQDRPGVVYIRTPDAVEVSTYSDMASESGTWVGRWRSPEGDVEVGGRYFAQWRKVDGDWKIRAEVFVGLYCRGGDC